MEDKAKKNILRAAALGSLDRCGQLLLLQLHLKCRGKSYNKSGLGEKITESNQRSLELKLGV